MDNNNNKEVLNKIIQSPLTKSLAIAGGSILLFIGLGFLFKVLAQMVGNYKDLRDVYKR